MFKLAKRFARKILDTGGRVAIEWPADSGWWDLEEVQEFERQHCFRRVYFHGCMLGVKGKELPIKKPWCVSTCDERLIQIFSQFRCDGNHQHEPAEGNQTNQTGFYTTQFVTVILESWFPKQAYHHIPNVSNANHACVTKNLSRAEWTRDERGLKAVQDEAAGLRANGTCDDNSVTTLNNPKAQVKATGVQLKIASRLTLCGIKYWECPSDQWKYKGRIVYRGDLVKDQSDHIVLFENTATCPTGLTALNITLFYGMLEGNSTSCGDAVQAFLQAPLEEETWIIIGEELWLTSLIWHISSRHKIVRPSHEKSLWPSSRRKALARILKQSSQSFKCRRAWRVPIKLHHSTQGQQALVAQCVRRWPHCQRRDILAWGILERSANLRYICLLRELESLGAFIALREPAQGQLWILTWDRMPPASSSSIVVFVELRWLL